MTTLVISDLHLGARSGIDLLRREQPRDRLFEALEGVERLVLLGDVLELRDRPLGDALVAARPFLESLGAALGERPAVLVAGNHDHRLLEGWRERRRRESCGPLGAEQRIEPADASEAAAAIAGWMGPARVELAYPGLWLSEDVYATHGHHLDRHLTVPAFEPLAVHAIERMLRGRGDRLQGADGYEAVLAPVYAVLHELAQSASAPRPDRPTTPSLSARAYRVLAGDGARRRPLTHRLAGAVAFPAVVLALNAAGLGPLRADLSGPELRRSSLRAMGEVVAGLEVRARHVVFGHTHRAGPLPGDDPAEWVTPAGARLHNSGSWVVERFLGGPAPQDSPYRAGAAAVVEPGQAPAIRHLLDAPG